MFPRSTSMNLAQLETFVQVAQSGSLSRAAGSLGLSQPSLSRQIRLLEADLNERLFHRTGRGVALTEAGTCLLAHARTIVGEVHAARKHLQDLKAAPSGRVLVGVTASLAKAVTPHLVNRFRTRFPGCAIGVIDGLSAQLGEYLLEEKIEVALLYTAGRTRKLQLEPLTREELVLVCGTHMKGSLPAAIEFRALPGYPLILPSVPNPMRMLVETQCRRHGLALSPVAEVNAVESLVAMVASSDCYSILPYSRAAEAERQGQLALARIHTPRVLNQLSLATVAGSGDSTLIAGTRQILRDLMMAGASEAA